MKTIDAAEFGEQCAALLDEPNDGGPVICKGGKRAARLRRYGPGHAKSIGSLSQKVKVRGNIFNTGARWEAGRET